MRVGYGATGQTVAAGLEAAGIPYVVAEMNVATVRAEKARGVPIVLADATRISVLNSLGVARAQLVVLAINDSAATQRIAQLVGQAGPQAHIVARVQFNNEVGPLRRSGAHEVVPQELEASIEILVRVLRRFLVADDEIGRQVRAAFYGVEAQRIQRGRDDIKVMVRYPLDERQSVENLEDLRIRTPDGREVPFDQVADLEITEGFSSITRVDRRRVINITADADKGVADLGLIKASLKDKKGVAGFLTTITDDYPGITWSFQGEAREQADIFEWGCFAGGASPAALLDDGDSQARGGGCVPYGPTCDVSSAAFRRLHSTRGWRPPNFWVGCAPRMCGGGGCPLTRSLGACGGEWGWEGRRPGHVDVLQCRWCPSGGSAPGTAGACARAVHQELAGCQPCCSHCTSSRAEQFRTPCACKAQSPRCSLLLLAALLRCLEFGDTPFADGLVHRRQCTVRVHRVSAAATHHQWSV